MIYGPDLTGGVGANSAGLMSMDTEGANALANYLRSLDPNGKSTAADLIQVSMPGGAKKWATNQMASLLGLGNNSADSSTSDAPGALAAMASLY